MTQANNVAIESSQINSSGVLQPAGGGTGTASGVTDFKNRIINGAMVITQYNGTSSVTPANGAYIIDRWLVYNPNGKFATQQNAGAVTPPIGFSNYLGITSLSAYSIASGDIYSLMQRIEGFNTSDLGWGTANAKTVTLSFQVYSSLTGTFGGSLLNGSGTYSYPFTYSIPVANTWTTISITVAGPTAGTWIGATNGIGLIVIFGLGVGSTNSGTAGSWTGTGYYSATGATSVVGTNGATFYITGVQLEVGSSATNFAYRSYGTELALCQRYAYTPTQQQNTGDICGTSIAANAKFTFPVTMRTTPTASLITSGSWIVGNGYSTDYTASSASIASQQLTPAGGRVLISGYPGFSSNFFVSGTDVAGTAVMLMSAEL